MTPTLTLSRAAAVLHGVPVAELERPELAQEAVTTLKPLLQSMGFDVTRPIHISALPGLQGFHLTQ
jgi:hypothetical protein